MLKCFSTEVLNILYEYRGKVCFRCGLEEDSINAICLNCNTAIYCNKKCMKKNRPLHENLCKYYMDHKQLISLFMSQLDEDYKSYRETMYRVEYRRNKDKF